jgi:hypothetical protein
MSQNVHVVSAKRELFRDRLVREYLNEMYE